MCRVISISNQKGGVAKTVTSVNMGIGLAREGKKVLLIDADPQGSLTISLGYEYPDKMDVSLATIMMKVINDEPVMIGDRYYIRATVTLTDGEESVSATAYAREDAEKRGMDGCQLTGACSSYARKYALNALLMIDDSKDSDDDSLSPKNPANKEEKFENRPDPNKVKKAPELPKETVSTAFGNGMNEFMERFGITSSQEALKKFNEYRNALIRSGALKQGEKMQTAEEVTDSFDAIYKNIKPSGEVA